MPNQPHMIWKRDGVRLRSNKGEYKNALIQAYEIQQPYALIVVLHFSETSHCRLDITSEALAEELRNWMDGSLLNHPAYLAIPRTNEVMDRYIKFSKPPAQEDLILWILSRCTLNFIPSPYLEFGQSRSNLSKSIDNDLSDSNDNHINGYVSNEFQSNADENDKKFIMDDSIKIGNTNGNRRRPQSASATTAYGGRSKTKVQMHTFELTQQILGKSHALTELKNTSSKNVKGRKDAQEVMDTTDWTEDHYRLGAFIERGRNAIESTMEERRRTIEFAETRQSATLEKYREIRNDITGGAKAEKWLKEANHEMITLHKIENDIRDDLIRQRARAHRAKQHVIWSMAPAGDAKLRGKSIPGPYLGEGPLPSEVTTSYKDPRIEKALEKSYWDSQGRRHALDPDMVDNKSQIEIALELVKKAASSASLYKLDLKSVFKAMDTDNSGYLSFKEFSSAMLAIGARLSKLQMEIVFQHFDPNDSGSINCGEFQWAFFNRRSLTRRWARSTKDLSEKQLREIFHSCDISGDGTLDSKEFKKLLEKFHINLSDDDRIILIDQFDKDGDRRLDLEEFKSFMESEQKKLQKSVEEARLDIKEDTKNIGKTTRRRPKSAVPSLNSTAPANLQSNGMKSPIRTPKKSTSPNNKFKSSTLVPKFEVVGNSTAASTDTQVADYMKTTNDIISSDILENTTKDNSLKKSVKKPVPGIDDPSWLAKVLKIQNDIECKLGSNYFPQ